MNNISEALVKDYALALNRVRTTLDESTIKDARDEMTRMNEAAAILWPGLRVNLELAAMALIKSIK